MSLAPTIAALLAPGQLGCTIGPVAGLPPSFHPPPIAIDDERTRGGGPVRADFFGHTERLPFHDHALDYLVAAHGLERAADRAAALAECHRVVRPGGLVILIVAAASIRPPVLQALLQPASAQAARWEIARWIESARDTLAALRVHKGWLARAQAEAFRVRAHGHPRAVLRDDAQSFAEWAANSRG